MKNLLKNMQEIARSAVVFLPQISKVVIYSPVVIVLGILKRYSKTIKRYIDLANFALSVKF